MHCTATTRNGTFTDVSKQAGVENSRWGLGVAVGDYDNDRRPDLYVCNYGANTLYRNLGDGTFRDVTAASGVGDARLSSSAAFADYDQDGWLDLYVHQLCPIRSPNRTLAVSISEP